MHLLLGTQTKLVRVEPGREPCGPWEPIRVIVKRWKLVWFDQVTRHYTLCNYQTGRVPSISLVDEGDNVRAGPKTT